MSAEITIGIPTCARPEKIAACLESVRRHVGVDHQVIVVDSAVTDENRNLYAAFPGLRSFILDAPKGPSACRALIADNLSTPYLLYLDDDMEVTTGAVSALYDFLVDHPIVDIAAGGLQEYARYRPIGQRFNFVRAKNGEAVYKSPITIDELHALGVDSVRVDVAMPCMLVRREVFGKVGFDPRYDFFYDLFDFFMQCHRQGVRVEALANVIFQHKPAAYEALTQRQLGHQENDRQRFIEKWNLTPIGPLGGVVARADGAQGRLAESGGFLRRILRRLSSTSSARDAKGS